MRSRKKTVLEKLMRAIRRHVILSKREALAVALWVVHTHTLDQFRAYPRLCLASPEPGCGKTTVLNLLSHLVRDGLMTAHATAAAIFREISLRHPTLLL